MLEAILIGYLIGLCFLLISYLIVPRGQKQVEAMFDKYNCPKWLRPFIILCVVVLWPIWIIEAMIKGSKDG